MKLLFENWRKYNENPFQLMCEQYERKVITEAQLLERWEQIAITELNELNQQLNEIDWEKEAELTADPDYKPPHERRSEFLQKGWEKINDWILKQSIRITEMARTAKMAALKAAVWLYTKVQDFCDNYPITCKIVAFTLLVIICYIIASILFAKDAQAKLYQGKKPLNDSEYHFIKGRLSDKILSKNVTDPKQEKAIKSLFKILKEMEKMQESPKQIDILKAKGGVGQELNKLLQELESTRQQFKAARGGQSGVGKLTEPKEKMFYRFIETMVELGKKSESFYEEYTAGSLEKYQGGWKGIPKSYDALEKLRKTKDWVEPKL